MNQAEVTMSVIGDMRADEDRDIDFLFLQLASCASDRERRDVVRSLRRQIIVVAAEYAQTKVAS